MTVLTQQQLNDSFAELEAEFREQRKLAAKRDRRGECKSCGRKIFQVVGGLLGKKKIPLNVEDKVLKGRCLDCFPLELDACDDVCIDEVPLELDVHYPRNFAASNRLVARRQIPDYSDDVSEVTFDVRTTAANNDDEDESNKRPAVTLKPKWVPPALAQKIKEEEEPQQEKARKEMNPADTSEPLESDRKDDAVWSFEDPFCSITSPKTQKCDRDFESSTNVASKLEIHFDLTECFQEGSNNNGTDEFATDQEEVPQIKSVLRSNQTTEDQAEKAVSVSRAETSQSKNKKHPAKAHRQPGPTACPAIPTLTQFLSPTKSPTEGRRRLRSKRQPLDSSQSCTVFTARSAPVAVSPNAQKYHLKKGSHHSLSHMPPTSRAQKVTDSPRLACMNVEKLRARQRRMHSNRLDRIEARLALYSK